MDIAFDSDGKVMQVRRLDLGKVDSKIIGKKV